MVDFESKRHEHRQRNGQSRHCARRIPSPRLPGHAEQVVLPVCRSDPFDTVQGANARPSIVQPAVPPAWRRRAEIAEAAAIVPALPATIAAWTTAGFALAAQSPRRKTGVAVVVRRLSGLELVDRLDRRTPAVPQGASPREPPLSRQGRDRGVPEAIQGALRYSWPAVSRRGHATRGGWGGSHSPRATKPATPRGPRQTGGQPSQIKPRPPST